MLDWDDLRFLLAVERTRRLSAAGEKLRVTQSTVGRRLARLERCLGVRLMARTPNGYVATVAGREILNDLEKLEDGVLSIVRRTARQDLRLEGTVRIVCVQSVAHHVLASRLVEFHSLHPDIIVELPRATHHLSLSMRDADIAVRFLRPDRHELVVRTIGNVGFGLYASCDYLERYGEPDLAAGSPGHIVIAPHDDVELGPQARWLREMTGSAKAPLRTDSYDAQFASAVSGEGLACLPRFHADRSGCCLRRILAASEPPAADLFLTVHGDNRNVPRIRAVMNFIVEAVQRELLTARASPPELVRSGSPRIQAA